MSNFDKSPPLSPSILAPKKYRKKEKKYTNSSTQTESYYTCYVQPKDNCDDYTAFVNLPDAKFFNQRPEDPRNELFAALVAFEMESIQPENRSLVYMKIINLIHSARAEMAIEKQGSISQCPSPEY